MKVPVRWTRGPWFPGACRTRGACRSGIGYNHRRKPSQKEQHARARTTKGGVGEDKRVGEGCEFAVKKQSVRLNRPCTKRGDNELTGTIFNIPALPSTTKTTTHKDATNGGRCRNIITKLGANTFADKRQRGCSTKKCAQI